MLHHPSPVLKQNDTQFGSVTSTLPPTLKEKEIKKEKKQEKKKVHVQLVQHVRVYREYHSQKKSIQRVCARDTKPKRKEPPEN